MKYLAQFKVKTLSMLVKKKKDAIWVLLTYTFASADLVVESILLLALERNHALLRVL